jgi:hypothetical protein
VVLFRSASHILSDQRFDRCRQFVELFPAHAENLPHERIQARPRALLENERELIIAGAFRDRAFEECEFL